MSEQAGVKVDFSTMKEPSQEKYINSAGIWRGATINTFGIAPLKLKDEKKPEGPDNKKTGGWLEMTFEVEKEGKFTSRMFPLPTKEEDVKFVGKVYGKDGAELRDKTKQEQMQDDYESFAYFLMQIGMALGNDFQNCNRIIAGATPTFEGMVEAAKKAWFGTLPTKQKVDFKTVWQNSAKNKSSYLQLPKAGYSNIVIASYDPNAPKSRIEFTKYEKSKQMTEDWPYQKKAAAGAAGAVPSGQTGWTPPIDAKADGELF